MAQHKWMLYFGRFPAAGTKSTNKKDPLQVFRLRTALPAEPTSFFSWMLVLCLGIVYTYSCVLPGYEVPNSWRDKALKSRALKPLPDPHHPNPTPSGLRQLYLAKFSKLLVLPGYKHGDIFTVILFCIQFIILDLVQHTDPITERTELWDPGR